MKKFLLLAVVAITACAASAQMNLTKAWQTTAPALANTRQGIAMDGKFLINDKVQGKVFAYDENGAADWGVTGATAAWPAIAKDDAGNVIVRVDNSWPGSFKADTTIFKIFPAGGGEPIDVEGDIFADFSSENGRMDYLGHAEGNLMEEGAIYIVTSNSTGVLYVPFVEGEIDPDHINLISVEGIPAPTGTAASYFANSGAYVDAWDAADGTKHYLLYWRGINPYDMVFNEAGDMFIATAINVVNRGTLTGYKCFSRDGKNYIAYSLKPEGRNYGDGFAIMEIGGEEPIFSVEDTGKDLNNSGICVQWFDIDGDKLFQYAGAQYIACYQFAGGAPENELYIIGEVNNNEWAPNVGVKMETTDGKIFTKDVVLERPAEGIMPKVDEVEGNKYCYFSFATQLADDWAGLEPYRIGAVSEATADNPNGDFRFYKNMMGQPLALTAGTKAFQVEEGTYTLTVDMEAMTLTIVGESKTAIETINVENKVKSGRFNLLGQPVNENYKGIVIENGVKKIQK